LTPQGAEHAEEERWKAQLAGDTDTLGSFLADDLVYTHSNGSQDSKESFLNALKGGSLRFISAERSGKRGATYGDTVVVAGRAALTIEAAGNVVTMTIQYSSVWGRHEGNWQLVGWHSCKIE
jgi:ketosteroid isomerase-like protein